MKFAQMRYFLIGIVLATPKKITKYESIISIFWEIERVKMISISE